ncbi:MAG: flippase activity-associated protein Agl23 [Verrucomicrobiota bacterium]
MEKTEKTGSESPKQAQNLPAGEGSALGDLAKTPGLCCDLKALLWGVLALALVLRLAWLGIKPPHFDEGVNGWFVDQMTKSGYYHYDPGNYHGPFHFYVLFLAQTLFGRSATVLRIPLVLVNVATIWFVLQFRRFISWRACVLAALAFAVSPGMLFYSRYSIHEAWLLFAMILAVWGAAEMWTRGTARGLWCVAMGITLMVLTKETYIIHLVAFGLAGATLAALERFSPSAVPASETDPGLPDRPVPRQWGARTLTSAVLLGILLVLFFYSGGFLDPESLKGLVQTFEAWFKTGVQGHGHEKPFYYWGKLIGIYEWPALIGLIYSVRALFPGMNRLTRFIAIYGCGALVAYSLVPYKTPWCIISLIWPFLFLFGEAMDELSKLLDRVNFKKPKLLSGSLAALVLAASLAWSARLNYFHPTDPHEPYVYVQTMNDFFKLSRPLNQLVAKDPTAYHMTANILLSSYHPLPWVLGDFTSVGYYEKEGAQPPTMDAGFLIAEEDRVAKVEAQLQQRYFVESFQLRDAMPAGKLYLNYERFASVFPGRTPEFDPLARPAKKANAEPAPPSVEEAAPIDPSDVPEASVAQPVSVAP